MDYRAGRCMYMLAFGKPRLVVYLRNKYGLFLYYFKIRTALSWCFLFKLCNCCVCVNGA